MSVIRQDIYPELYAYIEKYFGNELLGYHPIESTEHFEGDAIVLYVLADNPLSSLPHQLDNRRVIVLPIPKAEAY
jgi:hypothetical protein